MPHTREAEAMNEPLKSSPTRRTFLQQTAAAGLLGAATARSALHAADSPNEKVVIGVMGTSRNAIGGPGRGTGLATGFASLPGAEVAYVCDVDQRNVGKAVEAVAAHQSKAPVGVGDFRKILDDPAVDALVIATPDHWHAPATILACAAGKHVYVEKPCSHNAREGELMVAAARKQKRVVQLGTQRRSWPGTIEAMERLHKGEIGRVISARCFYFNGRPSIGHGTEQPVPEWLNYNLWQGPAPERPYRSNVVHYNWHWFWHWGTGELGNNGVHVIDVARWGLGVDYARRVMCLGGKFRYDDDQETPDTNTAVFDFGDKQLVWDDRSWAQKTKLDADYDVGFFGEKGVLVIRGPGYAIYDLDGKEIGKGTGSGGDPKHLQNFLDAVRGTAKLNAEIEEGFKSSLLCHVGNISSRTGRAVQLDPQTHQVVNDPAAAALWTREYRPGWEPKV
jgi:predicted dehydrogenase